jgi:hypothetical protein
MLANDSAHPSHTLGGTAPAPHLVSADLLAFYVHRRAAQLPPYARVDAHKSLVDIASLAARHCADPRLVSLAAAVGYVNGVKEHVRMGPGREEWMLDAVAVLLALPLTLPHLHGGCDLLVFGALGCGKSEGHPPALLHSLALAP